MDYRSLTMTAGYCWLDLRHAGAVAKIRCLLRSDDPAAVAKIENDGRRTASLFGRGLLHYLANRILGKVRYNIAKTESGRPFLQDESGNPIAFTSISHSHNIVAAALDSRQSIGVDVEYRDANRDFRRIARRLFSPALADRIDSPEIFYPAWCLYEAWGKAGNLQQMDAGKNGDLMQLLEKWLDHMPDAEPRAQSVTFFVPAADYAGCVFRMAGDRSTQAAPLPGAKAV